MPDATSQSLRRATAFPWRTWTFLFGIVALFAGGCTTPKAWLANGFKVGPNYCPPNAPIARDWIDSADERVLNESVDHAGWWTSFNDPVLNRLVAMSYHQNLTLRAAGVRILQARAERAIAVGSLFPQQQTATGSYSHSLASGTGFDRHFSNWNSAFSLAWEVDLWGRFRRAIEAADADLDVSVETYGDVLITLVADVASTYVDIRTLQVRLELAKRNVAGQRLTYERSQKMFAEGASNRLDVEQARSNLAQTEAFVPQLEQALRQAENQLCILLGIPPTDLDELLGDGPIPTVGNNVAMGIPADLLRRRPDVRRAERQLAAQSARIGIAETALYPTITLSGNVGVTGNQFEDLFRNGSSFGSVGPSFRWNIFNYGRIFNNVRVQEAIFQQLLLNYQQTVLAANAEAENALIFFLKSQQRLELQLQSADAASKSNELIMELLEEGEVDFNRVFNIQNFATSQELSAAQAKGDVARALISIFRALGGGWPTSYDAYTSVGPVDADSLPMPASPQPETEESELPPEAPEDLPFAPPENVMPMQSQRRQLPQAPVAKGWNVGYSILPE